MIRGKGTGFVKTIDSDEDLLIERENLGFALDGDIVEVTLKPAIAGKRQEAATGRHHSEWECGGEKGDVEGAFRKENGRDRTGLLEARSGHGGGNR